MRTTVNMPPPEIAKTGPITLDEIKNILTRKARDEADTEQLKAIKALTAMESSAVTIPDPLTDAEVITRLARLNLAGGPEIARLAFRKAFPSARLDVADTPAMTLATLPQEVLDEAHKIISLPMLYRAFPDVKRTGQPPGFPNRGSVAAKQTWCRRAAAQLILDREQAKSDALAEPAPDGSDIA